MSHESRRKRALEDYYLLHPPLPRRIRLLSPDMIKCYSCGTRAARVIAEDNWRVFQHEDGEWDEYCPACSDRGPSNLAP